MKLYILKDKEINHFPKFQERPWIPENGKFGVEYVDNPREANYIICPVALHRIKSKDETLRVEKWKYGVEDLPYWTEYEYKFVFFDCSDYEVYLGGTKATLIRCNVRDFMLKDPNTISWFWPVDNLKDYCNHIKFKYDVSFQGWLSTDTRKNCVESCKKIFGNNFYHQTFTDFHGHRPDDAETNRRRETFLKLQQETKILLAPQSIQGVFPYRFYEAMSSARVPALFCSGYYLPFQNEIDWDKCTIRFDAEQSLNAGELIKDFLNKISTNKIVEMGIYGREMWEKWLNRDKQQELIAYILNKRVM